MTNQAELLSNKLKKNEFRLTKARRAIIETLAGAEGHITADDLAVKVQESAPHVGRMTVYRTLELLTDLGVIRPIYQGTGAAHYVVMTGGSHHHLICNNCHQVIEFDQCTANDLIQQMADQYQFQVSSHLLELHGLCQNCLHHGPV